MEDDEGGKEVKNPQKEKREDEKIVCPQIRKCYQQQK